MIVGADDWSPCETKTKLNSVIKLKSFVIEKFPSLNKVFRTKNVNRGRGEFNLI